MELDDKILDNAIKKFNITRDQAKQFVQEMIDDGLLQNNNDPSMPFDLKLTTLGNKYTEKIIKENFGEFKKVTNHKGISYKVPTAVIIREGIKEEELLHFPLWNDDN